MEKYLNRIIFFLSILGFLVSAFLSYEYLQPTPVVCPLGGGCETVRNSEYSKLFGIFIPYFGVLFYFVIGVISAYLASKKDLLISKFRFLVATIGFGFGVYLTFLEAFIIHAYCFWCVLSFIISVAIFMLCWVDLPRKMREV